MEKIKRDLKTHLGKVCKINNKNLKKHIKKEK